MVANGNRISAHFPESKPQQVANSESVNDVMKFAQSFISERPVFCLAGAFATGVLIACFLKRTR